MKMTYAMSTMPASSMDQERIPGNHPDIGNYVVRASKVDLSLGRASKIAKFLNSMVSARKEGISDRFKVLSYHGKVGRFVVYRKLLKGDLVCAIEEN